MYASSAESFSNMVALSPIPKDPSDWPDYKLSFLSQALSRGYVKILTGAQQEVVRPLPLPENPTSVQVRVHSKAETEFETYERNCNHCWADLVTITGFGKPHGSAKYKSIIRAQNVFEAPLASIRNVWLAICATNENLAAQVQRKEPLAKIMELNWIETDDPSEDLANYAHELMRLADISAQQGSIVPPNFLLIQLKSKIPSKYLHDVVSISLQGGNTFETFLPMLKQVIATRQVLEPTQPSAEVQKAHQVEEQKPIEALFTEMAKRIADMEVPTETKAMFTATLATTANKFIDNDANDEEESDGVENKPPKRVKRKTRLNSPCTACGLLGHWQDDPHCPCLRNRSINQSQQQAAVGGGMAVQGTAGGGTTQQQHIVPVQQPSMLPAPTLDQAHFAALGPGAPHARRQTFALL